MNAREGGGLREMEMEMEMLSVAGVSWAPLDFFFFWFVLMCAIAGWLGWLG